MKLQAFIKVAKLLNNNKILWAVGGSFLLYIKGIIKKFNDFDIMIAENDVEKVKRLLSDCGTLKTREKNRRYRSKAFLEYVIEETDFDIIAGFVIISEGVEHYFPLEKKDIVETVYIDDTPIPLQSVEEWKDYYYLK